MIDFLGIAREPVYSPGKVEADRAILDAVAAQLGRDARVRVVGADDAWPDVARSTTVFTMCQGPRALGVLHRWRERGVRVVNAPVAIESCHRARMLAAFAHDGIAHPESRLIATDQPDALPPWADGDAWVKRGDVHATEPGDVVKTADRASAAAVLADFRRRGIAAALLQRHVDGDVIKFYAVRGRFFASFAQPELAPAPPRSRLLERLSINPSANGPHFLPPLKKGDRGGFVETTPSQNPPSPPFFKGGKRSEENRQPLEGEEVGRGNAAEPPAAALAALAERGAAALALEVYGGDCVRDRHGNLWLIDLNDWPSYAACRSGAAEAIAGYLREQASAS